MTHDMGTAKQYYQQPQGQKNSVDAYETINGDHWRWSLQPTPKAQKVWSDEEEDTLKVYLLEGKEKPPSLQKCAAFLMLHKNNFAGRTKKTIQDKCRTITKKLKRTKCMCIPAHVLV